MLEKRKKTHTKNCLFGFCTPPFNRPGEHVHQVETEFQCFAATLNDPLGFSCETLNFHNTNCDGRINSTNRKPSRPSVCVRLSHSGSESTRKNGPLTLNFEYASIIRQRSLVKDF